MFKWKKRDNTDISHARKKLLSSVSEEEIIAELRSKLGLSVDNITEV